MDRLDIGEPRYLKAPSASETLADARRGADLSEIAKSFTYQGNNLKPYAPVDLSATVDNVGNISISWTRSDRRAGDRTDYENFPLSETNEEWEIDVINGGEITRTIKGSNKNITYLATEQITDFGSVQNSVTVRVYQVSSEVGRGYSASATLTPTLQEATPVITSFSPMSGVTGDTITLFGSGLAGVMAIKVASAPLII